MERSEVGRGEAASPRRRGRPLRDPSLAGLPAEERRARYRDEERTRIIEAYRRLGDCARVAAELGLTPEELERRLTRLAMRRQVARLAVGEPKDASPAADGPAAAAEGRAASGVVIRRHKEGGVERPDRARSPADRARSLATSPVVSPVVATAPAAAAPPNLFGRPPRPDSSHGSSPGLPARRFVAGPAARRDVEELAGECGAAALWEIVEANKGNRRAIEQRLGQLYADADGRPLSPRDVDELLRRHGLADRFRAREAENVRFLFGFHKGARAKVAQALLLDPQELHRLLADLHLDGEVEAMRERQRAHVREKMPMPERLRLVLTREKYLADIGILPEVDRDVEAHVKAVFARCAQSAPASSAVEERVRRELGLDPESMRRLLRRYRLHGLARSLLSGATQPQPATSGDAFMPPMR